MPNTKQEDLVELDQEDPVEVELADDDPSVSSVMEEDSVDSGEIPEELTEEELASYSTGVRKRIDKLTAKYREAERREIAALEYAKGVQTQNQQLQKNTQIANANYGKEYAGRVTTDLESAKQRYVAAYESGDPEELVTATTDLSRLTIESATINNEVPAFRSQQPMLQHTPATAPPPDPKSQAWANKNPWFGTDEAMTYTSFAIHKRLVEGGMDTNSDAYYNAIDSSIRQEFPHKFQDTGTVEVTPSAQNGRRSSVQRVASANRAAKSTGRDTIKLTPSQVAIAKKLGVPLEDYARQVKEIQANV
jgi:hypothetical protein